MPLSRPASDSFAPSTPWRRRASASSNGRSARCSTRWGSPAMERSCCSNNPRRRALERNSRRAARGEPPYVLVASSPIALPLVVQPDDARRVGCCSEQLERRIHAFGQQSLTAAERQRIDEQVQLVD